MVRFDSEFSRRKVVGSIAGIAAASLIPSAAHAQESSPEVTATGDEAWTFTDDLGVTITLPRRPTRIVADLAAAAPLWDFGIRPLAVSGWTVTSDTSWGNVDRTTPILNTSEDVPDPDIEKLIELEPDLYVTISKFPDDPDIFWSFTSPESKALAETVMPIVTIAAFGSAAVNMGRYAELAAALGIDLDSPDLVAAKETFESSVTTFTDRVAETADLTALFAYIGPDQEWYAAVPELWADLNWVQSLGLNIVQPTANNGLWETLSFEQALRYPSDILFNSSRVGTLTPDELQAHATFGQHPAVTSGQIGSWTQDFIVSYQGLAAALESILTTVFAAADVTP